MSRTALVTGGAGFIGSHIVDALVARRYEVVAYDSLAAQVHGSARARPAYLNPAARLVEGDVRDPAALEPLLASADVVIHQAAVVGVGQSMYNVVDYVDANVRGTAVLCEALARGRHRVEKVLVASSMSNYGEGRYACATHGPQAPPVRSTAQLVERDWELRCALCRTPLEPRPTDETKPLDPQSVYATTKRTQEELVLNVCRAYGIPAVALRYFNVYGPRQALSNPYTGVAAIFSSRILNGQAPQLFEDGRQSRDFTHVSDIVRANVLALESDRADGMVLNVGTGRRTSLLELSDLLLDQLGRRAQIRPEVLGTFREGDIRHCYADITRLRQTLGFAPEVLIERGMEELVRWSRAERSEDRTAHALDELKTHKLVR